MDSDERLRAEMEAEAQAKLRLARAVGGLVWALLKGVFYGLGFVAILIALMREFASRVAGGP